MQKMKSFLFGQTQRIHPTLTTVWMGLLEPLAGARWPGDGRTAQHELCPHQRGPRLNQRLTHPNVFNFQIVPADLNSIIVLQLRAAARLYRSVATVQGGQEARAKELDDRADRLCESVNAVLWDRYESFSCSLTSPPLSSVQRP
jgi:hypothetical protein